MMMMMMIIMTTVQLSYSYLLMTSANSVADQTVATKSKHTMYL